MITNIALITVCVCAIACCRIYYKHCKKLENDIRYCRGKISLMDEDVGVLSSYVFKKTMREIYSLNTSPDHSHLNYHFGGYGNKPLKELHKETANFSNASKVTSQYMSTSRLNNILSILEKGGFPSCIGEGLSKEQVQQVQSVIEKEKKRLDKYFNDEILSRCSEHHAFRP